MIYAEPNTTFTATVSGAGTGLAGTLGVRIEDANGSNVVARTTAGIVEVEAASGIYAKDDLTAPSARATYLVVWDNGSGSFAAEELVVTSSVPSFVSPSGSDLCTLADVRSMLQKQGTEVDQDSLLQALIGRASRAIMRYCEREFAPQTSAATRIFEIDGDWGNAFLSLAPYDLRTVTSVKMDTDLGAGFTLTAAEYRLFPRPAKDGVYYALRFRPMSFGTSARFGDVREVQITGDWGFPAVPDDIRHAAIVTVDDWFRRDVAAFSTTFNLNTDSLSVPQALPRGVVPILDTYRRMAY